jgi:hypothetical protein
MGDKLFSLDKSVLRVHPDILCYFNILEFSIHNFTRELYCGYDRLIINGKIIRKFAKKAFRTVIGELVEARYIDIEEHPNNFVEFKFILRKGMWEFVNFPNHNCLYAVEPFLGLPSHYENNSSMPLPIPSVPKTENSPPIPVYYCERKTCSLFSLNGRKTFDKSNPCPSCGFPGLRPLESECRHDSLRFVGEDDCHKYLECCTTGCQARFEIYDPKNFFPLPHVSIIRGSEIILTGAYIHVQGVVILTTEPMNIEAINKIFGDRFLVTVFVMHGEEMVAEFWLARAVDEKGKILLQ